MLVPGGLRLAAAVLSVALVTSFVVRGSYAAFSGATSSTGNSWEAGTVTIRDDDSGSTLFTASGLTPGDTGERCILVTYDGSAAADVRLYGSVSDDTAGDTLDSNLDLVVTYDSTTTGTFAGGCGDFSPEGTVYTGTLAAFGTTHSAYASGAGSWAATTNQTRVYRFVYTLNAAAGDDVQGDGVSAIFTWEAQNT